MASKNSLIRQYHDAKHTAWEKQPSWVEVLRAAGYTVEFVTVDVDGYIGKGQGASHGEHIVTDPQGRILQRDEVQPAIDALVKPFTFPGFEAWVAQRDQQPKSAVEDDRMVTAGQAVEALQLEGKMIFVIADAMSAGMIAGALKGRLYSDPYRAPFGEIRRYLDTL